MIRILIASPDEQFGRTLADQLRHAHDDAFVITVAATPEEAYQAVLRATAPFDVFLIDHAPGSGMDGIATMEELRRLSPTSETMILGDTDDPEAGVSAHQAGRRRYLPRTFSVSELTAIMRSARAWHDAQHERDWLRVLTEVAEEAQRVHSVQEVADVIVHGARRLGFERARLWLLDEDSQILVGISQVGNAGLEHFEDFRVPVADSRYMLRVLASRDPVVFRDQELGESYLPRHYAESGYQVPAGEWVGIPLWTEVRCRWVLILDNADRPRSLHSAQLDLLGLFGRQAAATLDRALQGHERDWLRVLTEVAERAQRAISVEEVAEVVVEGGRRLGFERVRLWQLSEDGQDLVGLCQDGNLGLAKFPGFRMPLAESLYVHDALTKREPTLFRGRDQGAGFLDLHFAGQGFKPPTGEWVEIPLWSGDRPLGMLALDNANQSRRLRSDQHILLRLFGRQVEAALERALQGYERDWLKTLTKVAEEVQHELSVRKVANIVVRGGRLLGFERARLWRLSQDNQTLVGLSQDGNSGLPNFEGFRMPLAKAPYSQEAMTKQTSSFFKERASRPVFLDQHFAERGFEPPVGEWVEMPLWVDQRCWGILTLDNARQERPLRPEQHTLLGLFGSQVGAALERAHSYEQERRKSKELQILSLASQELGKLAEKSEYWLWHATLTAVTAEYAFGFNRAILFLAREGGTRLYEYMTIYRHAPDLISDHLHRSLRSAATHEDYVPATSYDAYLRQLLSDPLSRDAPENERDAWELDLSQDESALRDVLRTGEEVSIPPSAVAERLPPAFVARFGSADYLMLPLRAGSKKLGLVVVENHPAAELWTLDHLKRLLTRAALISQNMHQRHAQDRLIDLNYTVLTTIGSRSLKDTLTQICQAAQEATGADCVVIYPLKPGKEPFEYDIDNVSSVGRESTRPPRDKPRQKGLAARILRSGAINVLDVAENPDRYDAWIVDHPFLQQERVRAFIGTPVRATATNELLGVLYINYRTPQTFTEHDLRQAESFASLAAVAIHNERLSQLARSNLAVAEAESQAREKELNILQHVFEEALVADTGSEHVVQALLNAARNLLTQPDARVELFLREWDAATSTNGEMAEVRRHFYLHADGRVTQKIETEIYRGITGLALRTGMTQRVSDVSLPEWAPFFYSDNPLGTRSELDVPIVLEGQVIGVFNVESPAVSAFSQAHQTMLERLAAAAALALDNVRRQDHLHNVFEAARAVTTRIDLQNILHSIAEAARKAAPGLSALTIWYHKHEDDRIALGQHFGVRDMASMGREDPNKNSVVWRVMYSPEPIWAPVAGDEPRLLSPVGRFIKVEDIKSVAAFPLRADGETVGAMFFNYRQQHEFSSEERVLFPILAEIAAASIRDAARLEAMRKEDQRLNAAMAIIEAVGSSLELSEVLRKILKALSILFPDTKPFLLIYNEIDHVLDFRKEFLEFFQIDNPAYDGLKHVDVEGPSIVSRVARLSLSTKKAEIENVVDVGEDESYMELIKSTRSLMCVTLMSNQRLLGILTLESEKLNAFTEDDKKLLDSVGKQVSMAIDRANKIAWLHLKATITDLTAWVGEIAHDMNRELYSIRSRASWISGEPGLSDKASGYTREINESADRLKEIIKDVELWYLQPHEYISLDEWLRQCVEDIKQIEETKRIEEMKKKPHSGVKVRFDLNCDGLKTTAHPIILQRIVRHLVRNALKAMKGTGSLIVRTRTIRSQWLEVRIEDTGPGVPKHLWEIIFRRKVPTKSGEGGLGLLLVRLFVEEMGGTVRLLSSEAGQGAAFAFTLSMLLNDKEEVSNVYGQKEL